MLTRDWVDVIACGTCAVRYDVVTDAVLYCGNCGTEFPIVGDIPILITESTVPTSLEDLDYDAEHNITQKTLDDIAAEWTGVLDRLAFRPRHALEIGAATGALTLALLGKGVVARLTATDVSPKFLISLASRVEPSAIRVSLVACDANEANFRPGAFDLVVGRSVLHHLLDYESTLANICSSLEDGGAAIFFEPVLEGKTVISLLLSLIIRCDMAAATPRLTAEQQKRVRSMIRHQMKSSWYPQDRESLARLEDKYIFRIGEMKRTGLDAGFRMVEFLNHGTLDPSYWPQVTYALARHGVQASQIRDYRWIGEEFANVYGAMFPQSLVTPMGFFVFRK